MTAPVFGDDVPEDVYDAGGTPDPSQVARRLHEIRSAMRVLAGGLPLPVWDVYERAPVETAATAVPVAALTIANAGGFAHALHDARRTVDFLPDWDKLTAEERELATAVAALIVAWLTAEGSIR